MRFAALITLIFLIQLACAGFFVWDILVTILGLRVAPLSWQLREFLEIGAALGLIIGVTMAAVVLRSAYKRSKQMEDQLRIASGAFQEVIQERFAHWGLTPAERDVALFSIKGITLPEIAQLRETSIGTVKAQTNAIYRKAGVSGRSQLLALFIEDLMIDTTE
ncbi:MAG: helix-turn-helix transcriptional regulator [Pseudomonadota bacterium]